MNLNESFNLKFQQTIAISCENQQVKVIPDVISQNSTIQDGLEFH